jgi:hypothetical protein
MDFALMSDPDHNLQFRRRWTETARPPPTRKRRPGQVAPNLESGNRNSATNKPTRSAAQAHARRPNQRALEVARRFMRPGKWGRP